MTDKDRYIAGVLVGSLYWQERICKGISRPHVATHLSDAYSKTGYAMQKYLEQMEHGGLIYRVMSIGNDKQQEMLNYVLADYASALDMGPIEQSVVIKAMSIIVPEFSLESPAVLPIVSKNMPRREDITLLQAHPMRRLEQLVGSYQ